MIFLSSAKTTYCYRPILLNGILTLMFAIIILMLILRICWCTKKCSLIWRFRIHLFTNFYWPGLCLVSYGARPSVVYVSSVCRVRWIQVLHLKWNIFEALLWMMSCRMTSFFSFKSLLKFSSDFCREKGQNMSMALILNERWVDNIALKYVLHTNLMTNLIFTSSKMSEWTR